MTFEKYCLSICWMSFIWQYLVFPMNICVTYSSHGIMSQGHGIKLRALEHLLWSLVKGSVGFSTIELLFLFPTPRSKSTKFRLHWRGKEWRWTSQGEGYPRVCVHMLKSEQIWGYTKTLFLLKIFSRDSDIYQWILLDVITSTEFNWNSSIRKICFFSPIALFNDITQGSRKFPFFFFFLHYNLLLWWSHCLSCSNFCS